MLNEGMQNPKPDTHGKTQVQDPFNQNLPKGPKPTAALVPPVDFQAIVKQTRHDDEMKRLYQMTEGLKNEIESFKRQAEEKKKEKSDQVRAAAAGHG
jgi:hypothetical protein